jgi:hypothetical protein
MTMKQMIMSVMAAAILALGAGSLPASAAMLPASPAGQLAIAAKDGGQTEMVRHRWYGGRHRHHHGFGLYYGYRPYYNYRPYRYYGGCEPVRRCWWDRYGDRRCRWVRRCY